MGLYPLSVRDGKGNLLGKEGVNNNFRAVCMVSHGLKVEDNSLLAFVEN